MQIAQVLAGYSLGAADLLRRAMGKKKKEVMDKERAKFLQGALQNDVDKKTAEKIFDLMAFFAGYGFNRSHSAAYGYITYQTAYLKHHYPHEFMAGLMSCDQDNTDNIVKFIGEARAHGLVVERPDVNESAADFTVVPGPDGTKVIRFGLGAVKGVGHGAVDSILAVRDADGPFTSMFDFCHRVDAEKANRRVIEALVKSGAFDGIGQAAGGGAPHRASIFAAIDTAIERGAQAQRDRRSGQTSLFGMLEPATDAGATVSDVYPTVEEWGAKQLLAFEKESLGFYISGHPLDRYRTDLMRFATATTRDYLEGTRPPGEASIGGVVAAYRERPTKKGDGKLAFFQLEDVYGQLEVIVFPRTFAEYREVLVSDEPILCTGRVKDEGEGGQHAWRLMLSEAVPLAELRKQKTSAVHVHLNADAVEPDQVKKLEEVLRTSEGTCETILHLSIPQRSEMIIPLGTRYRVAANDELMTRLERLFGKRVAVLA